MSTKTEINVRCVLEDDEGTRTEYTIRTDNRDRVAYELMAGKHRWPPLTEAMFLFMGVACWSALRRSGVKPYPDVTTFLEHCPIVEPIKEDGEPVDDAADAQVEVPPTIPVPPTT